MDNGAPNDSRQFPAILVAWDEKGQHVHLRFDSKEFRSFAFVKAILLMAVDVAEKERRMREFADIQMQAAQAAQEEEIRKLVANKKIVT